MTMMKERISRIVVWLLQCGATWLQVSHLELLVVRLMAHRVGTLPPDESLRLLFRVQAAVYPILGKKAVEYGGGLHTKHRHTRYHEFFANRVQAGQRVLDIGCGVGAVAFDVAERSGASVVAVDLSADNIRTARERFPHPCVEYRVQDGLKGDLKGKFDVVVLSNVLEHLNDRPVFLAEVLRVANPAKILIRVPLFERDWQVPLKKELGVEWRLDTTHETEYTLESFAKEIEEAGCRILHQEVRWGEIWAEVCAA